MKLHPSSVSSLRGFTLVEVFVVIAILAVLGTMTWQAVGMLNNREMNKTAEIQVAQLEAAMNAYRTDFADMLPGGDGSEWSSHVLYSALNCDADNDGEPDLDKKTGQPFAPYCDSFAISENNKNREEVSNGIPVMKKAVKLPGRRKKKKVFVIFDPWGGTFRYRLGFELRDAQSRKHGEGINPDFDIYSLGADALGDAKNDQDDNSDNVTNIRSWK